MVWKFNCPRCKWAVAEMVNTELKAITDTMDFETMIGAGLRCEGTYETNEWCKGHFYRDGTPCKEDHYIKDHCRIWYYFSLGDK